MMFNNKMESAPELHGSSSLFFNSNVVCVKITRTCLNQGLKHSLVVVAQVKKINQQVNINSQLHSSFHAERC